MDSIVGHKLLTFMDAFSGYNQIKMAKEDRRKLLSYKVMSFGLKNVGATY